MRRPVVAVPQLPATTVEALTEEVDLSPQRRPHICRVGTTEEPRLRVEHVVKQRVVLHGASGRQVKGGRAVAAARCTTAPRRRGEALHLDGDHSLRKPRRFGPIVLASRVRAAGERRAGPQSAEQVQAALAVGRRGRGARVVLDELARRRPCRDVASVDRRLGTRLEAAGCRFEASLRVKDPHRLKPSAARGCDGVARRIEEGPHALRVPLGVGAVDPRSRRRRGRREAHLLTVQESCSFEDERMILERVRGAQGARADRASAVAVQGCLVGRAILRDDEEGHDRELALLQVERRRCVHHVRQDPGIERLGLPRVRTAQDIVGSARCRPEDVHAGRLRIVPRALGAERAVVARRRVLARVAAVELGPIP